MRLGGMWRGDDGTMYVVVEPQSVGTMQPRWWVDFSPEYGDTFLGPKDPNALHTFPAAMFGEVRFALVLP